MLSRRDHSRHTSRRHSRASSSSAKHSAVLHALPTNTPTRPPSYLQPQCDIMSSTPSSEEWYLSSRANTTASRIFASVRRSLMYSKRRHAQSSKPVFNSAVEDRNQRFAFTPSHFRFQDAYTSPPTVEQIAMGLHLSRTPHLRPVGRPHRNLNPASQMPLHSRDVAPPRARPPPPPRSSLKKSSTLTTISTVTPATTPVLSAASMSTTTITSVTPSIAKSTRTMLSLKSRMSRFLPGTRSLSAPFPEADAQIEKKIDLPQKKAVRFSSSTLVLVENSPSHRAQD